MAGYRVRVVSVRGGVRTDRVRVESVRVTDPVRFTDPNRVTIFLRVGVQTHSLCNNNNENVFNLYGGCSG